MFKEIAPGLRHVAVIFNPKNASFAKSFNQAIEAAAQNGVLQIGPAETDIFIAPGFEFRVADRLLTNFHLPRSTLLMLVSAFAGMAPIRAAYRHAVEQRYRFFSYGDAMLIDRM